MTNNYRALNDGAGAACKGGFINPTPATPRTTCLSSKTGSSRSVRTVACERNTSRCFHRTRSNSILTTFETTSGRPTLNCSSPHSVRSRSRRIQTPGLGDRHGRRARRRVSADDVLGTRRVRVHSAGRSGRPHARRNLLVRRGSPGAPRRARHERASLLGSSPRPGQCRQHLLAIGDGGRSARSWSPSGSAAVNHALVPTISFRFIRRRTPNCNDYVGRLVPTFHVTQPPARHLTTRG
jgi:hypothetical protein